MASAITATKNAGLQAQMVGMDQGFGGSLQSMIAASGGRLFIKSGHRDTQKQTKLWNAALKKYGSVAAARKWVAPPGHSNHEKGIAADLGGDLNWAHKNAARFGLYFPMDNEAWHIEPIGSRSKSSKFAYTDPGAAATGSIDTFIRALVGQESGGNTGAKNARTGALGLGQILPSNYPSWAREAGVNPADRSGQAQMQIIRHKVQQYYDAFGNWRDVAIAWYAGPNAVKAKRNRSAKQGAGNEPSINEYADTVMRRMGLAGADSTNVSVGGENTTPLADNHDITTHLMTLSDMLGGIGDPMDIGGSPDAPVDTSMNSQLEPV